LLSRCSEASAWVVAVGLSWPRVAPLLRPVERGYAVVVVLVGVGWLAAATHYGPEIPRRQGALHSDLGAVAPVGPTRGDHARHQQQRQRSGRRSSPRSAGPGLGLVGCGRPLG
jgi:hypothetical protein